jgi:hypothetical protein
MPFLIDRDRGRDRGTVLLYHLEGEIKRKKAINIPSKKLI